MMLRRFFQDYKQLEGKSVEVDEIQPAELAMPIIEDVAPAVQPAPPPGVPLRVAHRSSRTEPRIGNLGLGRRKDSRCPDSSPWIKRPGP